jgi:hypothetical protein
MVFSSTARQFLARLCCRQLPSANAGSASNVPMTSSETRSRFFHRVLHSVHRWRHKRCWLAFPARPSSPWRGTSGRCPFARLSGDIGLRAIATDGTLNPNSCKTCRKRHAWITGRLGERMSARECSAVRSNHRLLYRPVLPASRQTSPPFTFALTRVGRRRRTPIFRMQIFPSIT